MSWVRIEATPGRCNVINRGLLEFVGLCGGSHVVYEGETTLTLHNREFSGPELADLLVEAEVIDPTKDEWTCSER